MNNQKENTIITLVLFIGDVIRSYGISILSLFGKMLKPVHSESHKLIDILIEKGPKSFKESPTAIKIGRALFVPFFFIFQKK